MTPAQAKQRVTQAPIEAIPVDKITVGIRRREKVGQIDRLTASIRDDGLMHPILVDEQNVLIVGARRLEAVKQLEWKTIPGRKIVGLSPEEKRQIETDENVHRLGYETHETTKERSRQMALAEERLRTEAEGNQDDGITSRSGTKRGRPEEPGSVRAKARAVGVSKSTAERVDEAAALGDRFPVLAGDGWSQTARLEAGAALVTAHETGFGTAAERLIEQQPPAKATTMLTRLAALPVRPRDELVHMIDSREAEQLANVRTVLTTGKTIPPEILVEWKAYVERGARLCASIARRYPKLNAKIAPLVGKLHDATSLIEEAYEAELTYWKSTITDGAEAAGNDGRAAG